MKRSVALLFTVTVAGLIASGCDDGDGGSGPVDASVGSDAAVTPADAPVAVDSPVGTDTPAVSRDLPPYERAPAPPPISGHTWTHKLIGTSPAVPGDVVPFEATTIGAVLRSTGTEIGLTADAASLAFRRLKGDGEIIARVRSVQRVSDRSTGGLMVRADENDPQSASIYFGMLAEPNRGSQVVFRTAKAVASVAQPSDGGARIGAHFLRIRREGRRFTAARSVDKVSWVTSASVDIDMPEEVAFGLAAAARGAAGQATATRVEYDSVRLFGFDAKAAQEGFTLETIAVQQGNAGGLPEASLAGGVLTLSGVADGFTTTFEQGVSVVAPKSGALTITARVESLGDMTTPGARVALTFRDAPSVRALVGNSRNVLISVTASGRVQFQKRDRSTNFDPGASKDGLKPPLWLRLARYDDPATFRTVVAGYTSADGATWTMLDAAEYAVPDPTLAGVVLTSGAPETYASAKLTDVSIVPTTGPTPVLMDAGAPGPADAGAGN